MKPVRYIPIIMLFVISISASQEDWGAAQSVVEVAGCDFEFANPTFYNQDFLCYETTYHHEWETYKLASGPLTYFWEPQIIDTVALNWAGYDYRSPFLTYSKDKLYFSVDLPGGYGGLDIWISEWHTDHWGVPVNAGADINSARHDLGPSLPADQDEIYFYRNDNAAWEGTIFKSRFIDNGWTPAEELPGPVNINNSSFEPSISADGQKLYFCGYRPNIAQHIFAYVSYRNGDTWAEPILLNSNINMVYVTPPFYEESGDVFSICIDSLGMRLLFTHYAALEGFLTGEIRMSELINGISDNSNLPDTIDFSIFPNPFNAQTQIDFSLGGRSAVNISILDICGRAVDNIRSGCLEAGRHSVIWRPRNLSSGIYFVRLTAPGRVRTGKLILLK